MNLFVILAQTTTPTSQPAVPPLLNALQSVLPIILIVVVFYFLMFGSKRKESKQRENMLGQLKKGDRIQTIGGILGTVLEVRDGEVVVKVDESTNTKIKFSRSAIHKVIDEDKTETK